jgi:hypothetical protein
MTDIQKDSTRNLLADIELFAGLTPTQLDWVAQRAHRRVFEAGRNVLTIEQPGEAVYIILHGTVKIHIEQGERDVIVSILGTGDLLGEMSLIDSVGRSASAVTLENSLMLWMDKVTFNYLLDNFVAHKLSLLTECGTRELPEDANWLNTFILTCVFRVRLPAKTRAYVFNFIRRAEGALSAYREARVALIEYVNTPRNVLSPYFRALLNFEVCISQCYQGYELLATASGENFFERNDGSEAQ